MIPFSDVLSDKDRIFVYCPEDNSLQDESSLADLSTIAGSLDSSLDYSYREFPPVDATMLLDASMLTMDATLPPSTSQKDSPLKIIGVYPDEKRDDPYTERDFILYEPDIIPDATPKTPIPLEVDLPIEAEPNDAPALSYFCCASHTVDTNDDPAPLLNNVSFLAAISQGDPSSCCSRTAVQGDSTKLKEDDKKLSRKVGKDISEVISKCWKATMDPRMGCDEDPGRCNNVSNDSLSKKTESIPCSKGTTTSRFGSLDEKEKNGWAADKACVLSWIPQNSMIDDLSVCRGQRKAPRTQHEKWNQFVAHLGKVQQEDDRQSFIENEGDTRRKECAKKLIQKMELDALKTLESGINNIDKLVEEMQRWASTAIVVQEELNRLFDKAFIEDGSEVTQLKY